VASEFLKEFDDLLDQILVDYSNQDSAPDTTAGSITYIKAACLASCLWGIYRYQDYLAKQVFVDSADTDNLNHHGSIYGIARTPTDTDATYLQKILDYLRQPPAGGNKLDYENWAKAAPGATGADFDGIITVDSATIITAADGLIPGNISITVMPTDEIALGTTGMQDLVDNVYDYVEARRPVTANQMTVQQPTVTYLDIAITVTGPTGVTLDTVLMTADVEAFVSSTIAGDPVYRSQLQSICIQDGALNAVVATPASDAISNKYVVYRIASCSVTAV